MKLKKIKPEIKWTDEELKEVEDAAEKGDILSLINNKKWMYELKRTTDDEDLKLSGFSRSGR